MKQDGSISKTGRFESLEIFQTLGMEERVKLSNHSFQLYAAKGEAVFLPDQPADTIYVLKKGKVKIVVCAADDRERVFSIFHPGEIFGACALAGEGNRKSKAVALEPSLILAVALDHFLEVLQENPNINLQIIKMIGRRISKVQSRLANLCLESAPERIRDFIRELAKENGRRVGLGVEVTLKLKHEEIAQLTDTNRQMVIKVLNELVEQNIILCYRRRILIRNMEPLLSFSPFPGAGLVSQ